MNMLGYRISNKDSVNNVGGLRIDKHDYGCICEIIDC